MTDIVIINREEESTFDTQQMEAILDQIKVTRDAILRRNGRIIPDDGLDKIKQMQERKRINDMWKHLTDVARGA